MELRYLDDNNIKWFCTEDKGYKDKIIDLIINSESE